jgi:uncharacterized protein YdaU (DUF1376 family)
MSRSEPNPAFLVYAADEIADSASMTLEQLGMFTRLRAHAWREQGLPNDHAEIARRLGLTPKVFEKHVSTVLASFRKTGARLVLPDQEEQRARQLEKREKAQAAANARWDASAMRTHSPGTENGGSSALRSECPADADADAVVVAGASYSGANDAEKLFLGRFYSAATEERRQSVLAELARALSPEGVRVRGKTLLARSREHLDACLAETVKQGVKDPDKAIVVALLKLQDPPVDNRGHTVTEAASDRARAQERHERTYRNEKFSAAKAWAAENPDESADLDRRALEQFPAETQIASIMRKEWVLERIAERLSFPTFEAWAAREGRRVPELEAVS